jgi:uncharacterized protein YggE
MRWLLILALGTAPAAALAQTEPPNIGVSGSCTASATPDRARLFAGAEATNADPGRATAAAIAQYNRFHADVEKLALPDASLTSSGVQTTRTTETRDGREVPTGYTSSAGLTVETSSIQGLARVMQLAATDGLANIGSMQLYLSDPLRQKLEQSCLPKATADARSRAAAMLSGLGATLGAVLSVTDSDAPDGIMPRPMFAAARFARRAAPEPDLSAGVETVSVTVHVMFAIAPGAAKP